jgi:hypothetical protein
MNGQILLVVVPKVAHGCPIDVGRFGRPRARKVKEIQETSDFIGFLDVGRGAP